MSVGQNARKVEAAMDCIAQAAAIPIRDGRVCLITSSSGKRWIIPKGIIDPGRTAGETALVEAWEEAGLVGTLIGEPIGTFLYPKWGTSCHVTVFVMAVTEESDEWPEQVGRKRKWLDPQKAADRIGEPALREMLLALQTVAAIPNIRLAATPQ